MKPIRSILDPAFKWTPACQTDVRATWKRYRVEQKREVRKPSNVAVLPKKTVSK